MTRIKFCGLSRPEDIAAVNRLKPEYIGFVFAPESRRYVTRRQAQELKKLLSPEILAVGVFVNERPEEAAALLNCGIIDMAQLHGREDREYIARLRQLTGQPVIQAFRVDSPDDIRRAAESTADLILLDSGAGTGRVFDWNLIRDLRRPYFLAGGLGSGNIGQAVKQLAPFALDVSSGVETDGKKDFQKMAAFVNAVRKEGQI
jgi:phosphoribosylanthranilate isomerase